MAALLFKNYLKINIMKVRITKAMAGPNMVYRQGQIVELREGLAQAFVLNNVAEVVHNTKAKAKQKEKTKKLDI